MATPKAAAPVGGFNHNVKYGPRVYHVQTEDSGLPHAHYITHLFVGGNIVSSMKSSYAEKAGERDLARVVRGLMEHQHKAMLRRLVGGEFDELAERLSAQHYAPGVLADGTNTASYVNTSAAAAPAKAKKAPAIKPVARPAPVPPAPKAAPPAAQPAAPIWHPSPPSASPPRAPGAPLPQVTRQPGQPTRPSTPPKLAPMVAPARPAAAKPAAAPSFFSESPVEMPADDLPTLFAEELISEKSLDEVILAFLSADLEPPK
ncbi:MAG TPA: hypothetical protein VN928_09500 [Myxococcales bacterium]|nr:hypothetical protein [Myxococcales bacterium]